MERAGFTDNTFRPETSVLRQQFAKMVVLTLSLPTSEADVCPFSDVASTPAGVLYPDHYVAVAAARGITKGTSATTFSPYDAITRAQVITMVTRAADEVWGGLLTNPATLFAPVWDPALSPDHGPNWRKAQWNGLLDGLPLASLDPWAAMPRGEVAQVLRVFSWTAETDWQVLDVTQETGRKVAGYLTAYTTEADSLDPAVHVAATSPEGDLLLFTLKNRQTWRVRNVSA